MPRFGSFKPKPVAKQPDHTPKPPPEDDEVKDSYLHHSKDRDCKRRRDESRHDRHHRPRERTRDRNGDFVRYSSSSKAPPASLALPKDEFEESNLFIVDRCGDQRNVIYGSLHRYSVPAYHRVGSGRVVGTPSGLKIDRDESTEKTVVLSLRDGRNEKRPSRPLTDQRNSTKHSGRALRLVVPKQLPVPDGDRNRDFIRLAGDSKGSKRKRNDDDDDVPDGATGVDYRSIEGKAKAPAQPEDRDLEFALDSDIEDEEDPAMVVARNKNTELLRTTKEDPKDLRAWLELIHHQVRLVSPTLHRTALSNAESRSLADIRISIYERALKHVAAGTRGYDDLWLGILKEGLFIWETAKLASKWNDALKVCPSSIALWKKYLEFLQTNPNSFSFSKCKEAYIRSLGILDSAQPGSGTGATASGKVDIFLRLTCFMRDAGYDELSYALWQIVLEYYFFHPPDLTVDRKAELEALEEWWEADVPRVGEENGMGWDHFYARGGSDSHRRRTKDLPTHPDAAEASSRAALQREASLNDALHLPAAAAEDEVEDPYRFVMFSDVQAIIEHMLGDLPKRLLVDAFLGSMGLPPLAASVLPEPESPGSEGDHFIRTRLTTRGDGVFEASSPPTLKCPLLWKQSWTSFDLAYTHHWPTLGEDVVRFVDTALAAIVSRAPEDDTLAEYYLTFVLRHYPTDAAKTARRLLKGRPTSLVLYNAYALVEAKLGNLEKAIGVWKTALAADFGSGGSGPAAHVLLWQTWLMVLLHEGKLNEALGLLVSMANGASTVTASKAEDVPAAQCLKVAGHLADAIVAMLSKREYQHAARYVDCLAWFTYLTTGTSIDAALPVFTKYINILSLRPTPANVSQELLHQAKARIIAHHNDSKRPYKPATIRSELSASLAAFPENSMILSVSDMVRGNTIVDDRLRDAAQSARDTGDQKIGLISCCHKIDEELRRFNIGAATSSSVRAVFSSELLGTGSAAKHSIVLWSAWLGFEVDQLKDNRIDSVSTRKQSSKTTPFEHPMKVFYDGMRYMPWSKGWVAQGLSSLYNAGALDDEAVRRVLEVTEERELRVRHQVLSSVT